MDKQTERDRERDRKREREREREGERTDYNLKIMHLDPAEYSAFTKSVHIFPA